MTSPSAPDGSRGRPLPPPQGREDHEAHRAVAVGLAVEHTLDRTVGAAVERAAAHVPDHVKPRLRGWLHLGTAPAAAICGIVLVCLARGRAEVVACVIYALCTTAMFSVSATFHRGTWGPRAERWLQRTDHATIFLLIAGSYTPFTVSLLSGVSRAVLLSVVWGCALLGVVFRMAWVNAPRWLYVPAYLIVGWAAAFVLPEMLHHGGVAVVVLLVVGGAAYTIGGLVYALRRPDPFPAWFGFHEVFHTLTIIGYLTHFVAAVMVVVEH
jgi:hemolysin III